jgi:hypothetical protein
MCECCSSDSERGHAAYAHRAEMNMMGEGVVKNNPLLMAAGALGNENFTQRAGLFHNISKNIRLPRTDLPLERSQEVDTSEDETQAEGESSPTLASFHVTHENSSPVSVSLSNIMCARFKFNALNHNAGEEQGN